MLTDPRTTSLVGIALDVVSILFVPTPWTPVCRTYVRTILHVVSAFVATLGA